MPTNLHHVYPIILCQSPYTMVITLYTTVTIYQRQIGIFLQYSVSNFAIFEIIFYLSSTWTLISFVCNGFLKSFLFKLQKMVNT